MRRLLILLLTTIPPCITVLS